MAQEIKKISDKHQSKVHVIAHSFTGVDCRAAISMHNAGKYVTSLSTICTPHQGSKLVDNLLNDPQRNEIE